jgi:hypothetical protein
MVKKYFIEYENSYIIKQYFTLIGLIKIWRDNKIPNVSEPF